MAEVHEAAVGTQRLRNELSENEDLWTDQAGGNKAFEPHGIPTSSLANSIGQNLPKYIERIGYAASLVCSSSSNNFRTRSRLFSCSAISAIVCTSNDRPSYKTAPVHGRAAPVHF
jgi:hypothetical protein